MPTIHGQYEYDDDDLTPGKKKGGGLHQNLYDSDGNLKGNARFIPDDDQPDPLFDSASIYDDEVEVEDEEEARRRAEAQAVLVAFTVEVLLRLIEIGIIKGGPHAVRLWNEKVRPALRSRWARAIRFVRRHRPWAKRSGDPAPVLMETVPDEPSQDLVAVSAVNPVSMSRSEAQARYLLALAARALSDEQLRLVASARIHEDEGFLELQRVVAGLPASDATNILANLEADPSQFTIEALARLRGSNQQHDDPLAIEARIER